VINRKKILVVDDEQPIRSLLKRMLEKDYTIVDATNGREALDVTRREKPDLILMDLMMPGTDGYTACSALKTDPITADIPIVMLTAVDYELNKQLAGRIGASGYLTKPFNQTELMKIILPFLETA
jgi:two-component system, OmpR family, alkaline phosphatase synthesis response regulator PhoP